VVSKLKPKDPKQKERFIQIYFLLLILVGTFTLWSFVEIPGEAKSHFLFGLSLERIFLFSVVFLFTLMGVWFLSRSIINRKWFSSTSQVLISSLERNRLFVAILSICVSFIVIGCNFIFSLLTITEPVTQAYYVRLRPLILWGIILSGQTILVMLILKHGNGYQGLKPKNRKIYSLVISLSIIFLIWLWVGLTGIGITAIDEGVGWHALGTPLLEVQVLLAWVITIGFLAILTWSIDHPKKSRWVKFIQKDFFICTILWIGAFSLWMSQPLKPNWFASEPRPPNFEFYPNSDASVYDVTAQNLLLGYGFKTRGSPFTLRPLFSTFLAGLHTLSDLGYETIIWMQVAILALIPVILYFVTKQIHNRTSGFFAALLLIIREANAVKLGDSISEAHAKILLPFLPTALGILIFIYFMSVWLKNPIKQKSLPILLGGLTGIFMLIRPEFIILLVFIGLAALFQIRKTPKVWFRGFILISSGVIITLVPWIYRNYQLTGTIFIDSPHYRLDFIAKRFRDNPIGFSDPLNTLQPLETVTPTATSEVVVQLETKQAPESMSLSTPLVITSDEGSIQGQTEELADDVMKFVQENPETATNFIVNHLMNSVVQTVLQLPSSYPITQSTIKWLEHKSISQFWLDCCSLVDYERRFPFWPKWNGTLPGNSFIPVTLNLVLIAIGISVAWNHSKFIGLTPLFGGFGYYLINALVRNSGGRYIVPVNWIGIFYFSIGIIQITQLGLSLYRKNNSNKIKDYDDQPTQSNENIPILTLSNFGIGLGLFIFGCTLPILEISIPEKFDSASLETNFTFLLKPENEFFTEEEKGRIESYLNNGGISLYGSAFYPRHHKPYQMGSVWNYYHDRPYAHLDFYLSSPHDTGVVLPLDEPPNFFPNGSYVFVLACPQVDYLDALAIIIFPNDEDSPKALWRSTIPDTPECPLPLP